MEGVNQNSAHREQLPFIQPSDDLLDRLVGVLVLDDLAAGLLGRGVDLEHLRLGAALADLVGLDADVAGGLGVELLLLRAHDRLERRVARLVDRVADGDDGGQVDLDRVVAVLGLALARESALGHVDLDDLRQRGHLEMVGDDGADRVALAVIRLLAQEDQVGRLGLEHLREGVAGRADVRAFEGGVGEMDRAVGAERDCLVQGANGALGAHRHRDDLVDIDHAAFADLHRSFDAVRVERIQVLLAGTVQTLGG